MTKSRIALTGYISIMAMIRYQPMTASEIADAMGRQKQTISGILCRMRSLGAVHIAGWQAPTKGVHAPRYKFGPGEDAEYTGRKKHKWLNTNARVSNRPEVISVCTLFAEMQAGQCSVKEMCSATGMAHGTVCRALRHARSVGLARINGWERRSGMGGSHTPLWAIGAGNDEKRPDRKPQAQSCREWYARRAAIETNRALTAMRAVEVHA